ncbi:metallophosphoesterase [Moraxella sp. ZY210820]|uniref:metallophosphoesterase n=1 Tax=unclassified Moraxella TaxID=2685852 RepID=UPI00273183C7|nr:metallophosphoesterase [Moraxella sp. ZY210820]WLF84739.1 metallophosphoesterase [Moraxella sp. ZY210820]
MQKSKKIIISVVTLILLIVFYLFATSERIKIQHHHYQKNDFPQLKMQQSSLKIALITDLHSCFYGENQHEIMDILKAEQPDIILLGGDIYDDVLSQDNTDILLSQFKQLKAKNQVYYVNGNHELWMPKHDYLQVEQKIRDYGIHILHGIGANIPQTNIMVYGVADPVSGEFAQQLKQVGQQAQTTNFNILLSHRPEHIHDYLQYPFDMMFAGHAHGGQWRIPKLINGIFAPNQGFLPQYAGGEYVFGQKKFIVSRGLARESTRYIPRIFNRPEIIFIELNAKS